MAPQNPRWRQKFHDGVSRTRVACKRSAFASHKPRWRHRTPRWRRRIHDGDKNSTMAFHEPGWHENDPRWRLTNRVRLHSIRDSRKKSALPVPRSRWHDFFLRQPHTRHDGGKKSPLHDFFSAWPGIYRSFYRSAAMAQLLGSVGRASELQPAKNASNPG